MAGLGLAGVGVAGRLGAQGVERPLTPTFYQWIEDLHPGISRVNARFPGIEYRIAPVEAAGIERFRVAEAKKGRSTWDVYVGQTPFAEMTAMIEAGVIEPWDGYVPQEVIDDIIPAIREECSVDGKLYSWPFLLDVIGMGWHSGITARAGIAGPPPTTWEQYLENAHAVFDSGAAPFGATFDAHGWRSLAPFAHSLTTDVYTPEGLFDFTHDASVEALVLMKKIMAVSNPDVLLAGATDGGVNNTPDEDGVRFPARRLLHQVLQRRPALRPVTGTTRTRWASRRFRSFAGGEGSTVFWTTGCALLRHGGNKEKAAEYIRSLTYDRQLWKDSLAGTETGRPGHLPPYRSIYAGWKADRPDWLPDFVALVRGQLDRGARHPHAPVRAAAVLHRPAALGDLPQGRGGGPAGGAGQRCGRGPRRGRARMTCGGGRAGCRSEKGSRTRG